MLCTAASNTTIVPLRAVALSFRIQHQLPPTTRTGCRYSTTTTAQKRECPARRRVAAGRKAVGLPSTGNRLVLHRRENSTVATPAPTSTSGSSTPDMGTPLTWNGFLQLRRRRRHFNIGGSIISSLSSTILGVSFLSQQDMDSIGSQLYGLDPFMVLGLATVGFGVAGWLAGPVLGGLAFSVVRGGGGVGRQMAEVCVNVLLVSPASV
jgi:hypothetical protein